MRIANCFQLALHGGRHYMVCTIVLIVAAATTAAQTVATFKVKLPPQPGAAEVPVSVSLQGVTTLPDSLLVLQALVNNKPVTAAFQLDNTNRTLHWMVKADAQRPTNHVFRLVKATPPKHPARMHTTLADGHLTVQADQRNLWQYQFKTVEAPAGIDTSYRRSAFVHPIWSPAGKVLTRIQPPDHYHHYGLWNPWTHTLFKGDTVDFWNIGSKQGTVRFANFLSTQEGAVFAAYSALHEHVSYRKHNGDVALREVQTVRVYAPQQAQGYYIADITIALTCVTEPVTLLKYRYGGLGWRTTGDWDRHNSTVLSSEGKTRKDADGSKARWCIVQGKVGGGDAGAVMMSHPLNYNHPEPLRIWPENQYDRGDMFANFSPTKDRDWELMPGNVYVLRYRLLVFDGAFNGAQAEAAWQHFANPPAVTITVE